MRSINLYSIFIWLLLFSASAFGQKQALADFNKINEAYQKNSNLSMEIIFSAYSNYVKRDPISSARGLYKIKGSQYYSELDHVITIQNSRYVFNVDADNSLIMIDTPLRDKKKSSLVELDTMVSHYSRMIMTQISDKSRILTLVINSDEMESEYEKIDVYYNTDNYLINKFIMYFSGEMSLDEEEELPEEKPRLEMQFNNINLNPTFALNEFSESEYFTLQGNKFIGLGKYKSFEIIDNRLNK
jgi:hypothetical protein